MRGLVAGSSGLLARRCGSGRRARADREPAASHHTSRRRPRRKSRRRGASRRSRRRSAAQPVRADLAAVPDSAGAVSSVSGDPARWQRYQDLRDGVSFTDVRYERDGSQWRVAVPRGGGQRRVSRSALLRRLRAHRPLRDYRPLGCRSRSSTASIRRRRIRAPAARWCSTTRRSARSRTAQANLNAYVPLAPAFELRERRDIGRVDLVATPTPNLDVTASFTTQKHSGELPWGASFGFSNDVEVALPYDSRANDLTIGTEWTNARNMLRVAYSGSWFDNIAPTLTWDSPLRLDDASGAPGRGRMSLWPSNSAQTISFGGYTKLAHKTQVDGLLLLRIVEQRRAAAALHDQRGAAADRAAPREHRGGSARLFDQPEPHLAARRPTGGSARACATTPTTTSCRRRRSRT